MKDFWAYDAELIPNFVIILSFRFFDPWPWSEGSYELGSVRPSVIPSESFLGIDSLVFSETQHVLWAYALLYVTGPDLFLKNLFAPENGENGPKTGFFEFIGKFSH